MPFLVDSRRIVPAKRRDAVHEAFGRAGIPGEIRVSDLAGQGHVSVESTMFGPAEIFQLHGTGVVRRSTERHVKRFKDQPYVAILVPRSESAFTQDDHVCAFAPDEGETVGGPEPESTVIASSQRPIATGAFVEIIGHPGWKDVPVWAAVGTQDRAVGRDIVLSMAQRAGATITEVDGSHVIMTSQPDAVTEVILAAVKAVRPSAAVAG